MLPSLPDSIASLLPAATKGSIDKIDTQEIQLMELNSLKEVANNIGDAEMCLSWSCPCHSAVGGKSLEGF